MFPEAITADSPVTVAGLDLSLTGSGLAALSLPSGELATAVHRSQAVSEKSSLADHAARHAVLAGGIIEQVCALSPALVVVEGMQFQVRGKDSSTARRGFLWWAVVGALIGAGLTVVEVTPGQIKLMASGRGNASKTEVAAAYAVAWPDATRGANFEDRADASWAAAIGAALLGQGDCLPVRMTAPRVKMINRVRAVSKLPAPPARDETAAVPAAA